MSHKSTLNHAPTCVAYTGQVVADTLVLAAGHGDGGHVVGVWDAQVLAVNVHELQLKVAYAVFLWLQQAAASPSMFTLVAWPPP